MSSIIEELQADAVNSQISNTDLLRKALIVASKLDLTEFHNWLTNELHGYKGDTELPDYRKAIGALRCHTGFKWIPVITEKHHDYLKIIYFSQPISEIEAFTVISDQNRLAFQFNDDIIRELCEATGFTGNYQVHFNITECQRIIGTVRTKVLEWVLKLEKDGIKGDGLSFTAAEVKKAQETQSISINFGSNSSSQVQINSDNSSQVMEIHTTFDLVRTNELLNNIEQNIENIDATIGQQALITTEIEAIKTEANKPEVNQSVIKRSFLSIKNILEGTSGNLIASGIIYLISKYLGH